MRIAAGLLTLTLLGCQSSSPAPTAVSAPEPARAVTSATPEVAPPTPRRPLARLNPRRQRLEVGEAPPRPRPEARKVGVQVPAGPAPRVHPPVYYAPPLQARVPVQSWPPPAPAQARRSPAQVDAFMVQEQERIRLNNEMLLNRPRPGVGLTPEMQRIAYPQAQLGPSAAERRYFEARADLERPRYTPDNVRGPVGSGMPAEFNPGLQERQRTP
ncbi:MAG: hypothetical protein KF760_29115 [Candidatus Eremiobacteraeota bacterium]|nr:hypothetical protein [Candidatus Eremiobacteraeota bacterium]MCW5865966.1 hypothetical protein [Candidatus Eremiobacteraeota bacterium]